jgi:hypothetical protein
MARACSTHWGRNAYRISMGNSIKKRPLERPNVGRIILKLHLRQMGWGGMDWIDLAQTSDQWIVNTVMNRWLP